MKAINIISISITVIFIAVIFYYVEACVSARFSDWSIISLESDAWNLNRQAPKITYEAGLITLVFILFYVYVNIANMVKIKTTTTKVLSIIGVSVTGVILLWDFAMISSPTHLSFDEVSGAWLVFSLIMLAFSIVFLVQVGVDPNKVKENPEVLDDIV